MVKYSFMKGMERSHSKKSSAFYLFIFVVAIVIVIVVVLNARVLGFFFKKKNCFGRSPRSPISSIYLHFKITQVEFIYNLRIWIFFFEIFGIINRSIVTLYIYICQMYFSSSFTSTIIIIFFKELVLKFYNNKNSSKLTLI